VNSPKPKGRYIAGYLAKPMWRLRRFGGDGLYDRAVSRILKYRRPAPLARGIDTTYSPVISSVYA